MSIKADRRGSHSIEIKEKNRILILSFFKENPNATYAEAAARLGLAAHTIFRHVKAAESGN